MELTRENFFKLLFNPGEVTNFSMNGKQPNKISCAANNPPLTAYFCINALHPTMDLAPEESKYGRFDLPRRANANVVSHKTFLVEFDKTTLEEQALWLETYRLPITAAVFSGNKSFHLFITLTEEVTPEEYKVIAESLEQAILCTKMRPDESTKKPSQLARSPEYYRTIDGEQVKQELVILSERVSLDKLIEWISFYYVPKTEKKPLKDGGYYVGILEGDGAKAQLTNRSKRWLEEKADIAGWRTDALFVACDAFRSGYTYEEVEELILNRDGYLNDDSYNIIKDAEKKVVQAGQLGIKLIEAQLVKAQ